MMRKNLNGIVVVFLVFCGFLAWLRLGAKPGAPSAHGWMTPAAGREKAVEVFFSSSDGKKEWAEAVTEAFNRSGARVNGRPVHVTVNHMRTGESRQRILDGLEKPTLWGPAGPSWVKLMDADWSRREHQPFLAEVQPTVRNGLVIATWEPMARALGWPGKRIGWSDLVRVARDPRGWASYGHPEWGAFRFGHAHPDYSNSAMLSVLSEVYAASGKTRGLTPADLQNANVVRSVQATEQSIVHYGESSSWLVEKLCTHGPAYLSAVTLYESSVVRANLKYPAKPFPLVALYPKEGTFWETHPVGIVNAAWVTPEQREAARLYLRFLTAEPQQERACEFGFRPTRPGIPLRAPFDKEHGVDPSEKGRRELEYVSDEVFRRANELWHRVKKKASVYLVLDTSGSMQGAPLEAAKSGAAEFVKRMERGDEIHAWTFNSVISPMGTGGRAGEVGEELAGRVRGLFANGGTALYDATLQALDMAERERHTRKEPRLYAVVLLTDGRDTNSQRTETDVLSHFPRGEDAEGVRVFTIAYGREADQRVLREIAEGSNGRAFSGGTADVGKIYQTIAAYF